MSGIINTLGQPEIIATENNYTAGVMRISAGTQTASGTITFSNSPTVTFGLNAGTLTASAVGGGGGGTVTFSAGIASAGLNSLVFSNANGVSFGLNGSTLTATVKTDYQTSGAYLTTAAQSNQVVNSLNGSTGVISLATGSSLSSSSNGSTITFGLASNITTALQSANVNYLTSQSNQAVSGSNASSTFQTVTFGNSNGMSFYLTNGSMVGSYTVPAAQTVQSAIKAFGASSTGNTAGNTGVSTGIDWVLAGTNNITISESTVGGGPNTLWVSGPTVGGAQTGISGIANSQTTYTSGTVYLSEQGGAITINSSVNGVSQYYRFSVSQSTQPAVNALGVSNTGTTLGNTGTSSGITWVVAGSGNVTASQSTVGGGPNTIWISVPAQTTNGVQQLDGSAGSLTLVAGNLISVSNNASTISIINVLSSSATALDVASASAAGTLSSRFALADHAHAGVGAFGVSNTGTTAGNTASRYGTWVLAASGNVTASASSGGAGVHTAWISVPAQTSQSAIKGFGVSNTGTTLGNTGISSGIDWVIAGSGNITASQSTAAGGPNTVWLSVPAGGAGGSNSIGVSNLTQGGQTAGTTGTVASSAFQYVFAPGSNITMSQSTNGGSATLSIFGPSPGAAAITQSIGMSNLTDGGTTYGSSGVVTGDDIQYVFVPGYNIAMSQSTAASSGTLTIEVSEPPLSYYDNFHGAGNVSFFSTIIGAFSSAHVQPFWVYKPVSASYMRIPSTITPQATSAATTANLSATFRQTDTIFANLFTQGVGANSRSFQYVTGSSLVMTYEIKYSMGTASNDQTCSFNITGQSEGGAGFTINTAANPNSANMTVSTNILSNLFAGIRFVDIPFAMSLSTGEWWLMLQRSTASGLTTAGAASFGNLSNATTRWAAFGASNVNVSVYPLNLGTTATTGVALVHGHGVWTTNSVGATTSSFAYSQLGPMASQIMVRFALIREA